MSKEAMKQALEALEDAKTHGLVYVNEIVDLRQAIAEAEKQEQGDPDELTIAYMSGLHRGKDFAQQRTWVGLTDEEIDAIYWQHENHCGEYEVSIYPYERAIEAKLREKNLL
jgi:DhnA family fructose-bisphosphate aldolase class Ia